MPIETGILEPGMSGTPSLQWNRDDEGIVTLTLSGPDPETRGGVVVMDQWLLDSLCAALDQVEQSDPTGLILKSASNRVFVAGADLVEIDKLDDEALHAYLEQGASALHRINKLPCPSVCLINGAALGGGLEIAMHCDALVGVQPAADRKPYQVGLPEASLGLCPGWGGTQMLPARMDIYDMFRVCLGSIRALFGELRKLRIILKQKYEKSKIYSEPLQSVFASSHLTASQILSNHLMAHQFFF